MGPYALFQDNRHGAGIRPRPYTRNMAIQPFTYDSIKTGGWLDGTSLALPHGLGHGWAAVLWDLNWDLIDKHGFNPNVYGAWNSGGNNRSLQYVTDGLKLQGCGPGLVVARGAIVAATEALGGEDTCTVWADVRPSWAWLQRRSGHDRPRRQQRGVRHPSRLPGGLLRRYRPGPTLNVVNAGAAREMTFIDSAATRGSTSSPANSPYSRRVDCNTLRTVDPASQFITPRPIPVPTETPGKLRALVRPGHGPLHLPVEDAQGVGRHLPRVRAHAQGRRPAPSVLPLLDGPVVPGLRAGPRRGRRSRSRARRSRWPGHSPLTATTDANGFYSFAEHHRGTYTATASAGGCDGPQTTQVEVPRPTTLDFTLAEDAMRSGTRAASRRRGLRGGRHGRPAHRRRRRRP